MPIMNEFDAISGKQAKAFATIDGRVEELFYAKSLESTIEINKVDVPVLGRTNTPSVMSGWTGSGSMTIYYMTTLFRSLILEYIKNGKPFYFDLQVVNEDPASKIGKQTVVLKSCSLDNVIAAKFDNTSDDKMDEEISFTFNDYDILDKFKAV
ncbi:phage tail tube protein [Anaerophilus nitritogenes]|uniref:phage tail tube protein n=1 Tax=Anaerophilus nitritogenes TaxID=2498136 RepID=UPI00101C72C6|nr:phage tail tube protein [Anaerophilus nitritogenes]